MVGRRHLLGLFLTSSLCLTASVGGAVPPGSDADDAAPRKSVHGFEKGSILFSTPLPLALQGVRSSLPDGIRVDTGSNWTTGDRTLDEALTLFAARELAPAFPPRGPAGEAPDAKALKAQMGLDRIYVLHTDEAIDTPNAAASLETFGCVEWAHPNWIGQGGGVTPSDTSYSEQWHHENAGLSGAKIDADIDTKIGWGISTGSREVLVAVLDSGMNLDHPEFEGRLEPGQDFVNNDADPSDDFGHGTRVAGLLGATGNNGFAIAGVDWNCRLLPVKVLDSSNFGTELQLSQGLVWASDQGADIINMSLINYLDDPILQIALNYARIRGSILIACAGNGGIGDADQSYPGASALTIAVGVSNKIDRRWSSSGSGARLDFIAPGVDLVTVDWDTDEDRTLEMTGCSASTPLVSGVVSLLKGMQPALDQADAYTLLQAGAQDQVGAPARDLPGRDDFYGHGRINVAATLTNALQGVSTYGPSTEGLGEVAPILTAVGQPELGSDELALIVDEGRGGASGVFIAGFDRTEQPLAGGTFLIGTPTLFLDIVLSGSSDSPAEGSIMIGPMIIPDDPSLLGLVFETQAIIADVDAVAGFAFTNAVEIAIF